MTKVAMVERAKGKDVRIEVPAALVRAAVTARRTYEATMQELARAVQMGGWVPGYDGQPPEITSEARPNDNPQLSPPRNVREHPLDWMYHRRQIGFKQWSAGDQLRADLELAAISPVRGVDYSRIFASSVSRTLERAILDQGDGEPLHGPVTFRPKAAKQVVSPRPVNEIKLSALDRVIAARAFVAERLTQDHFEVARSIIADRKTLGQIGGKAGLGNRNTVGKRFRAALDCLADHYGRRWSRG